MTYEEFITELWNLVNQCPKEWRKGQAVFNVLDRDFGGVARDVQFIDGVDCFYNDELILEFIDCAWKRLNNEC